MLIVLLQVISYVTLQRLFRFIYRHTYRTIHKDNVMPKYDAHEIHGGMSMGLGLAWTSSTTIAKLQFITGTGL